MTIDPRERAYFERLKALLTEMEELKADLAALKKECVDDGGLTRERVSDLAAVAKLEVMDQAKRAAKDMQRKRRDELAGQLSMLDEPKKREPVTRAKPKEKPPEPPHDPETGEIVEGEGYPDVVAFAAGVEAKIAKLLGDQQAEADEETAAAGEDAATRLTDLPPVSLSPVETFVRAIAAAALADEPDLAAARRADFADDLEIPPYCDRRHEARRVPEAAE